MLKYVLRGIEMFFMPRKRKKAHRSATVHPEKIDESTAGRVSKAILEEAQLWSNETNFGALFDLIKQQNLEEVHISINNHRDVWWWIDNGTEYQKTKLLYFHATQDVESYGTHVAGLSELALRYSNGIVERFEPLLWKNIELLTFTVGEDYVTFRWMFADRLRRFVGEEGVVLKGEPVKTKLLKWFRENRAEIKRLMDVWGVLRIRGFVEHEGVRGYVLEGEGAQIPGRVSNEVLHQHNEHVVGEGEFGKELATLFNRCNIGGLRKYMGPALGSFVFEFGSENTLDYKSISDHVEILFPEA